MTATIDRPAATEVQAEVRPQPERRRLRVVDIEDRACLLGSVVAGLSLTWVLYDRILPTEGTLGFIVCWWLSFTGFYALITGLRRGRVVLADRFAVIIAHSAAGLVGIALTSVVGYTLIRGSKALVHWNFFTQDLSTAGPLEPLSTGGALHALAGTLIQISMAIAVTLPLGVLCAVYLTEVGGRASKLVRSVVEAMTALPSIVAGLFAYVVLLIGLGFRLSGFVAAMALSVMMLPIIARSAEVVLRLVPSGLREASLALGATQWRTVWSVVLPTARPGLATALVLGTARGIGETSPVLLTAGFTTYLNLNPFSGPMTSLPLFTFKMSQSPEDNYISRAFGAAALLLLLVLLLFAFSRWMAGRGRSGTR
ncbi:phosphate ABC transporter permease PstA [Kribbella sp. NPDC051718]|uniref:phosphate ABC transporter permease PstA n=1 Tax=Kribbella sp. NPDC051718 TaxID=3155168 RepID=UPI00342ADF7F